MGRTTGATPDGGVVTCAECGHDSTGRFCGRCGAQVAAPEPAAPATPDEPAIEREAVPTRSDEAAPPRRLPLGRLLALGAVVALLLSAATVWSPTPEEVVTVPGDGSAGARTSTISVGPLQRTYWEAPTAAGPRPEGLGAWLDLDDAGNIVLFGPYPPPVLIDRDSGAAEPMIERPYGTGTILEAGRVSRVGHDGATELIGEVTGDLPSPVAVPLQPFGDGWLSSSGTSLVALDGDLAVMWTATTSAWTRDISVTDTGHVVVTSDRLTVLDAESGAEVFERQLDRDERHPADGPALVHDGAVLVSGQGGLAAVELTTGDDRWRIEAVGAHWLWAGGGRGIAVRADDEGQVALIVDLTEGRVMREVHDVLADPEAPRFDGGAPPVRTDDGVLVPLRSNGDALRYGLLGSDGDLAWTVALPRDRVAEGRSRLRRDPRTGAAVDIRITPDGEVSLVRLEDGATLLSAANPLVDSGDIRPPVHPLTVTPMAVAQGVVATIEGGLDRSVRLRRLANGADLPGGGDAAHGTPWGLLVEKGSRIRALDRLGEQRWARFGAGRILGVAPTGVLIADDSERRLELLAPEDLEPTAATTPLPGYSHTAVTGPETVLVTTYPDDPGQPWPSLVALQPDDLTERWRTPSLGHTTHVGDGRVVDVGISVARVLDPADGSIVRTLPLSHRPRASAVVGDALLVVDTQGIHALDLRSGDERWRVDRDTDVTTRPITSGDEVLVGTHDGAVLRIDPTDGRHERVALTDEPIIDLAGLHEVLLVRTATTLRLVGPAETPQRLVDATGGTSMPGDEVRVPAP
jgi:outer membrane protein assembly factor BamB